MNQVQWRQFSGEQISEGDHIPGMFFGVINIPGGGVVFLGGNILGDNFPTMAFFGGQFSGSTFPVGSFPGPKYPRTDFTTRKPHAGDT